MWREVSYSRLGGVLYHGVLYRGVGYVVCSIMVWVCGVKYRALD